jgi:hypothetical protein
LVIRHLISDCLRNGQLRHDAGTTDHLLAASSFFGFEPKAGEPVVRFRVEHSKERLPGLNGLGSPKDGSGLEHWLASSKGLVGFCEETEFKISVVKLLRAYGGCLGIRRR